jgi:hypothetical protein
MNISTQTQIVYTFSLTKEEAHAVLEEPDILLKALKRQIVFHTGTPGRNGHHPKAKRVRTTLGPHLCTQCGRSFGKAGNLRNHQEKEGHGNPPAVGDADSSAT